ncbi:MAG: hypothetical protein WC092_06655 [Anaerovoracaceae bacterium]
MTDKNEIIRALRLWFQSGDVFEIRVLDAVTAEWMRPHMESGYFDYEHIPDAADAIGKLRSYRGAYATVNPVNPDLLARACNRIRSITKEPTTADSDIAERRWLLVDCDPKRATGISSTDAEHDAALSMACKIRDGLAASGWPTPILQDSGNGMQMMYRISLPAVDNELVKHCIAGIATAGDDAVNIDTTVHNPARIWRIPGTMNCKGDNVPSRPHRMAKILSVPDEIELVSPEQMECATSWEKTEIVTNEEYTEVVSSFDLDNWIVRFCPELGQPKDWKGGRKWVFPVCPFNENHRNRSAVLIQEPSGAIAFKCHHDGCAGNDWKKLRVLKEPGCYDRPAPMKVDIDGILKQKPKNVTKELNAASDIIVNLIPLPPKLYHVPGFIHNVMKFCLDTAPSPQPELAFASALALQGHLAGRKVECMGGIRTNPYIIMLAPSGSGKNHPRRVVRKILSKIGLSKEVFEDASSGQGIEDMLIMIPKILWLSDEIYEMIQSVVNDKTGTREKIMKVLLTLHTSAGDEYTTRVKAGVQGTTINCPHLTLLGACTSEGFFKSLNEHIIGHGMFARMELFQSEEQPEPKIPGDLNRIPAAIEHHALQWKNYAPTGSGNIDLQAKNIVGSEEVMSVLREFQLEAYREKMKLQKAGEPDWKLSLWSRAFESIMRFALIYACSEAEEPGKTILSVNGVRWARDLVYWDINNKLAMVKKYYYRTEFERNSEQIVTMMQRWHENKGWETPMPGWMFNRKTKELSPKVKDAVIQSLKLQERLEVTTSQTQGRSALSYRLSN